MIARWVLESRAGRGELGSEVGCGWREGGFGPEDVSDLILFTFSVCVCCLWAFVL